MTDLQKYSRFSKSRKKEKKLSSSREVWIYTRVSSKNQQDNYSLEVQREESEKFAVANGYSIGKYFGNEYESASSDFTRKEFKELITTVKKSSKKPFGVLVYVISRFSRTGGNAVSIVNDLVERLGVHLIEVNSGIDTTTDEGKLNIYSRLIEARRENQTRLKFTVPGMRKFVKSGHYLGKVPIGYDHWGPRVVDPAKRGITQKIVINETGIKLRKAWEWKLQGLDDVEIIKRLDVLGVKITKQNISSMWRRAFYCGIQTNAFLDGNPIKGKWEPLISEEIFWSVQHILDGNHQGYHIQTENESRPLVGTLYCPKCGRKLTGYIVRKKKRHYYKCQKCQGVSIAADSSVIAKTKGAHEMFLELLASFRMDDSFIQPFKLALNNTFQHMKADSFREKEALEKKICDLQAEMDILEERYGFGKINDEAVYNKLRTKKQAEMNAVREKLDDSEIEISNLDYFLDKSIELSQNIHNYWQLGSLDLKKKIQKMVFPEGIVVDTTRRVYLTSKVNSLFLAKTQFMRTSEAEKEKLPTKNDEESSLVAEGGFEPPTFGL
jgi:site-specific DNA recombinase